MSVPLTTHQNAKSHGAMVMRVNREFSPRVQTFLTRVDEGYLEDLADLFERGELTENGFTPQQEEQILQAAEEAEKEPPRSVEAFLKELEAIAHAD